jgi:hypothetical protein
MRVLMVLLVSAVTLFAANLSAQAQRYCNSQCLQRRIAALEAQIAQLNASTVKLGQIVTINAPNGCLSWVGPEPGGVAWVLPPCGNSGWAINPR